MYFLGLTGYHDSEDNFYRFVSGALKFLRVATNQAFFPMGRTQQ